jgi:PTS system ascorbate-specific IIA component
MNRVLLIAHAPLASALRDCAVHVFPDAADRVAALDVQPDVAPEATLAAARELCAAWAPEAVQGVLVLSDLFGATPCNVAQRLVASLAEEPREAALIAGVNVPMLLRALSYVREPLEALASRALMGGTQGVMRVAAAAPQNQVRRHHDRDPDRNHQQ